MNSNKSLFALAIIFIGIFAFPPDHYIDQWFWGLSFISIILAIQLGKRTSVVLALTSLYFLISTISCFYNPYYSIGLSPSVKFLYQSITAKSFTSMLSIGFIASFLSNEAIKQILRGFGFLIPISGFLMLIHFLFPDAFESTIGGGILNNPSISGCFIAASIPISFKFQKNYWFVLWGIIGVACAQSISAWATLFVSVIAILWCYSRFASCVAAYSIGCAMVVIGKNLSTGSIFESSGRFELWGYVWPYFITHVNPMLGAGAGSFKAFGPIIQSKFDFIHNQYFLWAHNDWLQIMFEFGLLGLFLALGSFAWVLFQAKNPLVFSSLASFGFLMLTQYPLRLFLPSLFIACLIRFSFDEKCKLNATLNHGITTRPSRLS